MAEMHKCGQGWAYCDGNCSTCATNNCYTATDTIPNSRIYSAKVGNEIEQFIRQYDYVRVVRCRECKHRPTKPEKYNDVLDLVFPDEACPCYCDNDPFYSWYPSDDWFCPRGERKGGEQQ